MADNPLAWLQEAIARRKLSRAQRREKKEHWKRQYADAMRSCAYYLETTFVSSLTEGATNYFTNYTSGAPSAFESSYPYPLGSEDPLMWARRMVYERTYEGPFVELVDRGRGEEVRYIRKVVDDWVRLERAKRDEAGLEEGKFPDYKFRNSVTLPDDPRD